jgi:N-carbamoyl-L-amino-acid hydrolase
MGIGDVSINSERLWRRLMAMAEIGATAGGGSHRLTLTDEDEAGRRLFLGWCADRGYDVQYDQVGNLFVRRAGGGCNAQPLAIGSHLDTQPRGGRFDGILGVLAALEVLETLDDNEIETDIPVDIVVWTNEEGSRFQPAMMGSGVHCGVHSLETVRSTLDDKGLSVGAELDRFGYSQGLVPGARAIGQYLELHIEQGPVLEDAGTVIGAVTGGQAIRWYELSLQGQETHAGPVPMTQRRDPMPALARVIDLVYQVGLQDEAARATIGVLNAQPGSINVMPGRVDLTVDLRHPLETRLKEMDAAFRAGLDDLQAAERKIAISLEEIWHSPVVLFDHALTEAVRQSATGRGLPVQDVISGAGHDAFHMARAVPSALVFVPCRDGLSHNEAEYTSPEHATAGANVLLDVALRLACSR